MPILKSAAFILVSVLIMLQASAGVAAPPSQTGASALPTDAQLEAFVQTLQNELLKEQKDDTLICYQSGKVGAEGVEPWAWSPGEVEVRDGQIVRATINGKPIPLASVRRVLRPGYIGAPAGWPWDPKSTWYDFGSQMDMAMWALAASGMRVNDPRMVKAIDSYLTAGTPQMTYSLAFRVKALAQLSRAPGLDEKKRETVRGLLNNEADALALAIRDEGSYGYLSYPPLGYRPVAQGKRIRWQGKRLNTDRVCNSNAQFGCYGVAVAEDAGFELSSSYWTKVTQHWIGAQQADGGWAYPLKGHSSKNMTDAGLNSLYLVVDHLWSNQLSGYSFPVGAKYKPAAVPQMQKTFDAIKKAWAWYGNAHNAPVGERFGEISRSNLYHHYGMQRLGLSSGRKYLAGTRAWYPEVAKAAYFGGELPPAGNNTMELAWRLMTLAFGRQPVLINKLQHGVSETEWNYYFRDVAHLMDYINHETEQRLNWQIVSIDADDTDFEDAPILFIAGNGQLRFTDAQLQKLKRYCDFGGTIVLHPNHNSEAFRKSAQSTFAKIFGAEFSQLDARHPVYSAGYGKPSELATINVQGLSDGGRTYCFLINGDIAGAWQLRMRSTHQRAFSLMMNLRMYAAPLQTVRMNGRLRPPRLQVPSTAPMVTIARIKHSGNSWANAAMFDAMKGYVGPYQVVVKDQVVATEASLAGVQIIHVTGLQNYELEKEEVAALKSAIEKGAIIVIDPAAGRSEAAEAGARLAQQLGLTCGDLSLDGATLTRGIDSWLGNTRLSSAPKVLSELSMGGKSAGVLAHVDVSAAANGHFVFENPGIGTKAARQLWSNLLTTAVMQNARASSQPATSRPGAMP